MDWGLLEVEASAALLMHLATAPVAETERAPGLLAVATGTSSNAENGIVSVGEPSAEIAARLVRQFATRGLPASWILPGRPASHRFRGVLTTLGCREETSGVAMGAELHRLGLPWSEPADVDIQRVVDRAGLLDWLATAEANGWYDEPGARTAAEALLAGLDLSGGPLQHWVARRDGQPIGFASAFHFGDVVGLVHLGVDASEQRRGIGRALAGARLAEGLARGCRCAVLGPSPDGAALYRTLGFATSPVPEGRWFYLPLSPEQRRA